MCVSWCWGTETHWGIVVVFDDVVMNTILTFNVRHNSALEEMCQVCECVCQHVACSFHSRATRAVKGSTVRFRSTELAEHSPETCVISTEVISCSWRAAWLSSCSVCEEASALPPPPPPPPSPSLFYVLNIGYNAEKLLAIDVFCQDILNKDILRYPNMSTEYQNWESHQSASF